MKSDVTAVSTSRARYSLRRWLVLALVSVVGALWLVSAVVAFRLAHHEADRLFDAHLRQTAETLLAIIAGGEVEHFVEELDEHGDRFELPIVYRIWRADRKGVVSLLVTSPGAPPMAPPQADGFFARDHSGATWRYFAATGAGGRYLVAVGQEHASRYRVAGELAMHMLLPIVFGLPLMALGVWWVVGRALRPVDAVAGEVAALDPQQLVRLDVPGPLPQEVAPLVAAIDALIDRVSRALDNERRFTADAAHELRTPLAALRVQAQVAGRTADADARRRALDQVVSAVDRMTHLVEQLLTLSRLDPAAGETVAERVELEPLAASVVAAAVPEAERHGQRIELEAVEGCVVRSRSAWLEIVLRNLIDNALRYGGEGARVVVRISAAANGVVLAVADDGPGIPPALRPHMLARFARGEDSSAVEGCGLGLSIVARIAELSGASMRLEDGLPRTDGGCGLAVSLVFAPA